MGRNNIRAKYFSQELNTCFSFRDQLMSDHKDDLPTYVTSWVGVGHRGGQWFESGSKDQEGGWKDSQRIFP